MNESDLLLDVGGTFIKIGAARIEDGRLYDETCSVPVASDGSAEEISGALAEAVRLGCSVISGHGGSLAAIGVCIPGPFDFMHGVPLMKHKFRSIYGMPLPGILRSFPGVPSGIPVKFIHDVNAALLGEIRHGNAEGYRNSALISLGTGLGFTISVDGRIVTNEMGSPRYPIYNMPFRDGILEDYVSKRGFIRAYEDITGKKTAPGMTVAAIGSLAEAGDSAALATFTRVAEIIAGACRDLLDRTGIECLLFGGQISRSFRFMEPALEKGFSGMPSLKAVMPVKNMSGAAFYGILAAAENDEEISPLYLEKDVCVPF